MAADTEGFIRHDFELVKLTDRQLQAIPPVFKSTLVACSFVTNEMLFLMRVFLLTLNSSDLATHRAAKAMCAANLGFLNRAISARALEFLKLADDFGSRRIGLDPHDAELHEKICSEILIELRPLRKARVFKLVSRLRNQLSHHYSLADFERYVSNAAAESGEIWLAQMEGNSIYLLGEELTNVGLFTEVGDAEVFLSEWIEWTREAAKLVSKVNSALAIEIAERYVPDMVAETVPAGLPASLFADIKKTPMPLFWYPFDGMDR
jgi:hypothetical protein